MVRIVLGVIAGFVAWNIMWLGSEKILSGIFPEGYGVHQQAFQDAIKNGGDFSVDTTLLLVHIVLGSKWVTHAQPFRSGDEPLPYIVRSTRKLDAKKR